MKLGAVILAEQVDYHEGAEEAELYYPMLPFAGSSVIKRELDTLRKAGVSQIVVLAGAERELLRRHLSHKGVIMTPEELVRGSSDAALNWAMEILEDQCEAVLVLPGNTPLLTVETVERLREELLHGKQAVRPLCGGEAGWPIALRLPVQFRYRGAFADYAPGLEVSFMTTQDEGSVRLVRCEEDAKLLQERYQDQLSENEIRCGIRVTLIRNEVFFGPGMYDLLESIDRLGSINAACQETGISYSKAWKGIRHIEEELGFPLLVRTNGGRSGGKSELTDSGRVFLKKYQALMTDVKRMAQNFFDVYFSDYQ